MHKPECDTGTWFSGGETKYHFVVLMQHLVIQHWKSWAFLQHKGHEGREVGSGLGRWVKKITSRQVFAFMLQTQIGKALKKINIFPPMIAGKDMEESL